MWRKGLVLLTVLVVALASVVYWSYSGAIVRLPVDARTVALTFDDGPNPPHTQALLDLLAEHDVRATFFLKGSHIEAFPDIARMVARAGHEIANHSYSHKPMISLQREAMQREIVRTDELIDAHLELDYSPRLFRPPYGIQGPGVKQAIDELGMISILMSDHGSDWEVTDPVLIAEAVLEGVQPGSIILLHDGHGDVDDPHRQNSRAPTVEATGIIIRSLKSKGYDFVTVSEMLAQ
ncbi:MAG: polysaccharide deacetylase family protein [Halioglobus sp.]|nr:polysaccharide deacetylase family protein [Halioglobus sp.]